MSLGTEKVRRRRNQLCQTVHAVERKDILNIGGFSDAVFEIVSNYFIDDTARFVREVEAAEL
ncbi:MAG: hypothetical protein R3C56_36910 [Pirellulaceae bacterium]